MTSRRRATWFAWIAFGAIAASLLASLASNLIDPVVRAGMTPQDFLWILVPTSFAFVGALIVSRQPRNTIGLLLYLPGLTFAIPSEAFLMRFQEAPASPSPLVLLALWYQNWSWLLLIMPILMILLLFPTGRPPGPRWRWLIHAAIVLSGALILLGTFVRELEPAGIGVDWTVVNPIGFIATESIDRWFIGPWFVTLPLLTLLCAASVVVRFRRARAAERQQIKWLLYGCIVFAVTYVPSFFGEAFDASGGLWGVVFTAGILAVPTSIAIAILRHRLYDIDVIIRRTLQYGVLTAILGGLYFGSVLLVQALLEPLVGGADTPPVVVVTTLALAALFNPLRVRVQRWIDRSFYRAKVDAERAVARFALVARNELDLDGLRSALFGVVGEALHPDRMALWLREPDAAAGRVR